MKKLKLKPNLGDKGITEQPLYACPVCGRGGFSEHGLKSHRCPQLPGVTRTMTVHAGWRTLKPQLPLEMVQRVIGARIHGGAR